MHNVVLSSPEVVVQKQVLRIESVIALRGAVVGGVRGHTPSTHDLGRRPHVGIEASRDGGMDGRAERRTLRRDNGRQKKAGHVCIDLHEQGVLKQSSSYHEFTYGNARFVERLDDPPRPDRKSTRL